ncbi:MAG: pyruvate, phosphate dikinase [candidate division WOR-3 bacterium]
MKKREVGFMQKMIYRFSKKRTDGSARMKAVLGGKGANLAEMARLGLPVPPGFTIGTGVCVYYMRHGRVPPGLKTAVAKGMGFIEKETGKRFGDEENPLLVSVRSGARASMPGMMDTVLNLGLNDSTVEGLARRSGNRRFALDAYRRLIQMFGDVVLKTGREGFEQVLVSEQKRLGVNSDTELDEEALARVVAAFKGIVRDRTGRDFPQEPNEQLWLAIEAVLKSWNNPRAKEYRRIYSIPDTWGTAVNIQAMVFGNLGDDSASGVLFTRDPATGENELYCEYLTNAQGEDIVAGIRTPMPVEQLKTEMPQVYEQLKRIARRLERHYQDMMDVEWTVEKGKLYILQCRSGKRSPKAAVKIACDMARERLISRKEAVKRIDPEIVGALLHKTIVPGTKYQVLAKGIAASPGAADGEIVLDAQKAVELAQAGRKVILVRHQTSADDVAGMAKAEGILTGAGGTTSHAAVVARGMGKPAVVGCESLQIDYEREMVKIGELELAAGAVITINGTTGEVIAGEVPMEEPKLTDEFETVLRWADSFRRLGVRTNADTPQDARKARDFGAEGIGLCRTEHMFFGEDRIGVMQEMILAEDEEGRKEALKKLLPMQRQDFVEIFRVMDGLPVTIRTLDPPLHEFLPKDEEKIAELAVALGITVERVKEAIRRLQEENPMLGFRGCRLGILYPEITEMQARAIFEAACQVKREGIRVIPEIMIPLVSDVQELLLQRQLILDTAAKVFAETGVKVDYSVGTMIEVPRAALLADEIARVADFFSYGTNDLTQLTLAYSRDDYGKFFAGYQALGIVKENPFDTLDTKGVGMLMKIGLKNGRRTNPRLKVGICGEHGGDPATIVFCHEIGLDYVSCSPYRVPVARLVAAQAAIGKQERRDV